MVIDEGCSATLWTFPIVKSAPLPWSKPLLRNTLWSMSTCGPVPGNELNVCCVAPLLLLYVNVKVVVVLEFQTLFNFRPKILPPCAKMEIGVAYTDRSKPPEIRSYCQYPMSCWF